MRNYRITAYVIHLMILCSISMKTPKLQNSLRKVAFIALYRLNKEGDYEKA